MKNRCHLLFLISIAGCAARPDRADFAADLSAIRSVGREGSGNRDASLAAKRLSGDGTADRLPEVLRAMKGAGPVAENWLRAVTDTIAERQLALGGKLPAAGLEALVLDRQEAGAARRLAYEWLARVDPAAPDRLIPGMLDDPSVEMRRDAVEREIAAAEALYGSGGKDAARAAYARLFPFSRDRDQVDRIVKRLDELGEKVDLTRHYGFVRKWRVIGPFDNSAKAGFPAVYPPETKVDYAAEYGGKSAQVRWVDHLSEDPLGKVDLNRLLGKEKGVVGYAAAEVESAGSRPVDIRAASGNAIKIWLNGDLLFTRDEYHHGIELDQYRASGVLRPGRNTVLIKVCQDEMKEDWTEDWSFQLRVCDATGGGIL